ncbi:MAG: hypothetical protein KC420_15175, partial [Myxococcales bacterium]|nr:hypothetical protein [Myxococcales bacterium]
MTSRRPRALARPALALALAGAAPSCIVDEVTVPEVEAPTPASPGETRTIELRFLRFDVEGFEEVMTI